MEITDLLYEKRDHIAWITLNRPEKLNALGDSTTPQITQVCQDAAADTDVHVVVITGQGEAFCAGGDHNTFQRGKDLSQQAWADRMRSGPNVLGQLLQTMPKPVVASVNGVAVGGGATIALACDLRIASTKARFCFPFVHLGLTPEFGSSYLLQRVVGLTRANALMMLGDFIDANTAYEYGLVNRVVAPADLASTTQEMATRLARMPTGALARIKAIQQFARTADFTATLEQEAVYLGELFVTPEHRAAVENFLQRKSRAAQKT